MEPTLESISDYNKLEGEKRKTVFAVIIIGLIIGMGYYFAAKIFNAQDEIIPVKEEFVTVPFGTHTMPVK
jgi:hypothetical protein